MAKRELSFGPYLIERTLAGGGTAEILLARRGAAGELVALKRLLPELAANSLALALLEAEAELTAALEHPGIARVLDRGEAYFAMEYLPGRTLSESAPRGLDETIALGAALAGVLAHVHAHGVVHRDVCPDNVLVTETGRVVLLDFGVAARPHDARSLPTGVALGTSAYVAPEQLAGAPIDARADVFSLGVLLWELATGRRLFRRANDAATLLAVAEAPIPPVRELAPAVPEALERLLARALEREPSLRPSAAELARELTAR